jgi:hypothetical protein
MGTSLIVGLAFQHAASEGLALQQDMIVGLALERDVIYRFIAWPIFMIILSFCPVTPGL